MAEINTNVMLIQILQRMEARDKAAEKRALKAEERHCADLKAAEERRLAAEERRRRDMLRMFRAISTRHEEEEPRRQYSENFENFLPASECPSPREERPSPLRDARIDPQQEPEAPSIIEELSELPKIAHAEPASSAPFSPPGPETSPPRGEWSLPPQSPPGMCPEAGQFSLPLSPPGAGTSPPGGERSLPPQSPPGMCPEAGQFSLPLSPPGAGTSPPGGERSWPPQSPPGMCPEAGQFSLPNTSPGLERSPPEGRRFLPRGVSGVYLPPEAEESDVIQGDLPEPGEIESKEPVGDASDGGTDRAAQKRVPAAIRKLHNSFTGNLHPSARSRTRSGGYRGGNRDSRTGAHVKRNCTRSRPHADEKPEDGVRSFGDDEGGDPRGDGQRSGQRRDEVRRKSDNVPLAAVEAL